MNGNTNNWTSWLFTKVIISLAKSRAKSGLKKQESPLSAMPASNIFWLPRSLRIMFVVNMSTSVPSWNDCEAAV